MEAKGSKLSLGFAQKGEEGTTHLQIPKLVRLPSSLKNKENTKGNGATSRKITFRFGNDEPKYSKDQDVPAEDTTGCLTRVAPRLNLLRPHHRDERGPLGPHNPAPGQTLGQPVVSTSTLTTQPRFFPQRVPLSVQRIQAGLPAFSPAPTFPLFRPQRCLPSTQTPCNTSNALQFTFRPRRPPGSVGGQTEETTGQIFSRPRATVNSQETTKVILPQRVPLSVQQEQLRQLEENNRTKSRITTPSFSEQRGLTKFQESSGVLQPQRVPRSVQQEQLRQLDRSSIRIKNRSGEKLSIVNRRPPLRPSLTTRLKPRRQILLPARNIKSVVSQTTQIKSLAPLLASGERFKEPRAKHQLCFGETLQFPARRSPQLHNCQLDSSNLDIAVQPLEETICEEKTLTAEDFDLTLNGEVGEGKVIFTTPAKKTVLPPNCHLQLTFSGLKNSLPFLCTPRGTPVAATPLSVARRSNKRSLRLATPVALQRISCRVKMSIAALYEDGDDDDEDLEVTCVMASSQGSSGGGGGPTTPGACSTPGPPQGFIMAVKQRPQFAGLQHHDSGDDEEIVGLLHQTHLAEELKADKSMLRRTLVHQTEERYQEALLDQEVCVYTCGGGSGGGRCPEGCHHSEQTRGSPRVALVHHHHQQHHQVTPSVLVTSPLSPLDEDLRRALSNPVAQVLRESEERQFVPIESEVLPERDDGGA